MFTGLVKAVGLVSEKASTERDTRFVIASRDLMKMGIYERGASISCNGVCLTLVEKGPDWFAVEVSRETLSKTTLASWEKGTPVNLEASLKMGDELGGHMVSGHVDGTAEIISITPEGGSHRFQFKAPDGFAKYIAPKGSVAIDGVSLTVNEVDGDVFGVNIIPFTWDHTNLSRQKAGAKVNFEADMMARYVARILEGMKP